MEKRLTLLETADVTETEMAPAGSATADEVQKILHELTLRVGQLESERARLEQENKGLKQLLEKVIDHRQKSHGELIMLLTALVSKLPINDVGGIVSKLVEHNTNVCQFLGALSKGSIEAEMAQPIVLKTLDQTRRDLETAIRPLVEELLRLETPFERNLLEALLSDPELFFTPRIARANRCFLKGHVARERVLREFGEAALALFTDVTTDPKLNPRPKPEEIVLAFRSDFEVLLQQNPNLPAEKKQALSLLHQRIEASRSLGREGRGQRTAFLKLSFLLELLHYYEHQNTEAPDVIFAQRLPAVVEHLVVAGTLQVLEEPAIREAECLLAFIINPDHRLMVINNLGKSSTTGKALRFVLRFRAEKLQDPEVVIPDFIRYLLPGSKAPPAEQLAPLLRLIPANLQRRVVRAIQHSDRIRKPEAQALSGGLTKELGLGTIEEPERAQPILKPEIERQMAWARVRDLISRRVEPGTVATAVRERLNAKYDVDEIRESWLTLIEADPMSMIRIFCQLPYLSNGKTDPIARTVLEVYVTRLVHEKYAATYVKIANSLRNLYKAKPDAPTLVNFMALVRWVDPAAANRLSSDVGIPVAAA